MTIAVAHSDTDEGHAALVAAAGEEASRGTGLLVLGSRRRSAIGKLLLGSTVQRVVLDSPVPVLVVEAAARD